MLVVNDGGCVVVILQEAIGDATGGDGLVWSFVGRGVRVVESRLCDGALAS